VAIVQKGKTYHPPHLSKDQDITIEAGDCIVVSTPGGGGFGRAFDRDPGAVAHDVARGYYTVAQAADAFGVSIAADGSVDAAKTAKRRAQPA
jgi:N-methylhydantoinase B